MHNDPPHPLHIPLAMTTLTEIRSEPTLVRRTVDAVGEAWRAEQRRRADEGERPGGFSIERDAQGIWYVQYPFFAGPAWTVTDRFLITSWSPMALRAYLDKIGERAGRVSAVR
jgi:hypothetical protein